MLLFLFIAIFVVPAISQMYISSLCSPFADIKPDEMQFRSMIRIENLAIIDELNAKYSQFYKAGPTRFTHLSIE
jgi:hypothetical protein